jgi:hypothetical protein
LKSISFTVIGAEAFSVKKLRSQRSTIPNAPMSSREAKYEIHGCTLFSEEEDSPLGNVVFPAQRGCSLRRASLLAVKSSFKLLGFQVRLTLA